MITVSVGPGNEMREKAANNVVSDIIHVFGSGGGEEGGHVGDVAGEKARIGATHALPLHDALDVSGSEIVGWESPIGNYGNQREKEEREGKE